MSMTSKGPAGHFPGHEKEPPQPHGPKDSVKAAVHSHSARPKFKIGGGKRGRKRGHAK